MDGCKREIKAKMGNVRARLKMNGMDWVMMVCLLADETGLERVVHDFYSVCTKEFKSL